MKKSVVNKWVKALRSGKYKQGTDHLKRNGKYCCLGVLCSITKMKNWKTMNYLSYNIREQLGLNSDVGEFKNESTKESLAVLNDTGNDFNRIADIIERDWKKL